MFSLHGGFLTNAMYYHRETIKLTYCGEAMKMALCSQPIRSKENQKYLASVFGRVKDKHQALRNKVNITAYGVLLILQTSGTDQRPGTNPPMKVLGQGRY